MHICFLTHEYPLPGKTHGGIGNFVKTLATELVKLGHRISVVGGFAKKEECVNAAGVTVYLLQTSSWRVGAFYANSRKLSRLIENINRRCPIDVLESPEMGLAFLKKIPGIRYVIRLHGGHHFFTSAEEKSLNWWKAYQEKRSFRKADHFIAVSQYVASATQQLLPINKNLKVIYNTFNAGLFRQPNPQKIVGNRLLFFGTVCEKKGIRQLVQAMPLVKKRFPNVELFIAGRDRTVAGQSYTQYLKEQIDPSVAANIRFLGEMPHEQIATLLEEAEVCVLPSHMEALGIAWLEALAMGKPFVGSITGPGQEIVQHGKTGLLADPFNPGDIADKIVALLLDKEKAKALGAAARQDVFQRFNLQNATGENVHFYEEIIKN